MTTIIPNHIGLISNWVAAEFGIDLGVRGRQPLNNQPYFRMSRLGDDTPIHTGGRAAFDYMVKLIHELHELTGETTARAALRAFIVVRKRYQPRYTELDGSTAITPDRLTRAIKRFVQDNSEGGKRAQAKRRLTITGLDHAVVPFRFAEPVRRELALGIDQTQFIQFAKHFPK